MECTLAKHLVAFGILLAASGSLGRASAQAVDGKAIFDERCRKCHGVAGVPVKAMKTLLPKLPTFDAAFVAARSDDSVVTILTNGKGKDMKSFKEKLTADEMTAVARYVRTLATKPRE